MKDPCVPDSTAARIENNLRLRGYCVLNRRELDEVFAGASSLQARGTRLEAFATQVGARLTSWHSNAAVFHRDHPSPS